MEVSPNALRKETVQIHTRADRILIEVELDEGLTSIQRIELLTSLLQTKSQCLNTLTLLREQGKK